MKALNPQDALFLLIEQRQQPMHVAGLHLFSPPRRAGEDYVQRLYQAWRKYRKAEAPFNLRPVLRLGGWGWEEDADFDVDCHLRRRALPRPGRLRELLALVSTLHGALLDRSRPLWEMHLIEGLADGRFAIYIKLHHALVDGVTGVRLIVSSLSRDAAETKPPLWAQGLARASAAGAAAKPPPRLAATLLDVVRTGREILPGIGSGLWDLLRPAPPGSALSLPFRAPPSPFNVAISGARRFVAQSYALARLRAIGKAAGATVNDVTLAVCAGALRRYLVARDALPATPLVAMVPVSLHGETEKGGNQVAVILAHLATDVGDPLQRLRRIVASTAAAKLRLSNMSRLEKIAHAATMLAPMVPDMITGRARKHPAFNLVISNVAGPAHALYLGGSRLDEIYPVSIPADYLALNITVCSYRDQLGFGFIACRRAVPSLQRMVDYLDQALAELETALASRPRPAAGSRAASRASSPAADSRRRARGAAQRDRAGSSG